MGGVTPGPPSGLGIAGGVTTRGVTTEGMGVGGACLNKLPPTGLGIPPPFLIFVYVLVRVGLARARFRTRATAAC